MDIKVACPCALNGGLMIDEINIRNFRCFEHLHIADCKRINVIVGDNGSGKTALLEALFFALASSTDLIVRLRNYKGIDPALRGTPHKLIEGFLSDLFFDMNQMRDISISVNGDGDEARELTITCNVSENELLGASRTIRLVAGAKFIWKDASNKMRSALAAIGDNGQPQFLSTGEDLPNHFYFASSSAFSAADNAERFSVISRADRAKEVFKDIIDEYPWMNNVGIEVIAGSIAVYAKVAGASEKIQLGNISGGINRFSSVLLAIASRNRSVILVDELEGGLYYSHHKAYWRVLIENARKHNAQLFVTTHSLEWIRALVEAAGNNNDDIALWRMERGDNNRPVISQFSGDELKDGVEYGVDVRGEIP